MPIPYPGNQDWRQMTPEFAAMLKIESEREEPEPPPPLMRETLPLTPHLEEVLAQKHQHLTPAQVAALKIRLQGSRQPPQNMPQRFGNSAQGGVQMMPLMAPEMFGLPPRGNKPGDGPFNPRLGDTLRRGSY